MKTILTLALVAAGLLLLDRLLLRWEALGWINYRRRGLSRGGAGYHALKMQSMFDSGAKAALEVQYEQVAEEDDSGEPFDAGDPREESGRQ